MSDLVNTEICPPTRDRNEFEEPTWHDFEFKFATMGIKTLDKILVGAALADKILVYQCKNCNKIEVR